MTVALVIPTIGRPSLARLLESLAAAHGPALDQLVIVDDRPSGDPLDVPAPGWLAGRVVVRRSGGRGPAAARNAGWRDRAARSAEWVAFLDDDVLVGPSWLAELAEDLRTEAAGTQGRVTVPLPPGRNPTDWERGTAGLADARWITADMAYRRRVLVEVGGFDERFPRAFREDADLALRVLARGHHLERGRRETVHPVRPAPWNASAKQQRGNADDALMRRLHGNDWYERAGAARGRLNRHVGITAAAAAAAALAPVRPRWALGAAALWAAGTAEFARARIAPGPRDAAELAKMVATSAVIPPLAVWHRIRGELTHRRAAPWRPVEAVLVDRDNTIIRDVPYNGDPALVEPIPGALEALDRVRHAGLAVGVVTNQSGIGRGLVTRADVDAVNERVEKLLGPFDTIQLCPHRTEDGCECRKPRPGLIRQAAAALGVPVDRCVVIGDIGGDVRAAQAAGARGLLVPTAVTKPAEIAAAPLVCRTLADAVDLVLGGGLT